MKIIQDESMFLRLGAQLDQELLKAAQSLAIARKHLVYAKGDLGGRREDVIRHINGAEDDIRAYCENEPLRR